MKQFNQKLNSSVVLKAAFGLMLLLISLQQSYGQCVQCNNTTTSGLYPSAIGGNTSATGDYSFAGGYYSSATGGLSFAFGNRAVVNGTASVALGQFVKASAQSSMAIGAGFNIDNPLINSNAFSLMIGFYSSKPTLFISSSGGAGVNNTGKIGIGNVTDPQAKLHIKADQNEEASLRLEPAGSAYNAVVYFTNSGHAVKAKTGGNFNFNTAEGTSFVFHQGDIFLDDIQSGIIMKSPNGQCWRGTLTDQGMLSFSQATCPAGAPVSVVQQPETGNFQVYPNPTGSMLTIETKLNGQATDLIINASNGQQLSRQSITSDKMEISLEHYVSGTYVLQLVQKGQVIESRKIVRQ